MADVQQRLGRYELREILGEGGFATVWHAWDPILGRDVALKALFPHLARNQEIRQRFLTEARAIAHLEQPNIVRFFDVEDAGDPPFYTMELIHGPTLARILAQEPQPGTEQLLRILQGLAAAVDYLHLRGLVHRDIKPANIMLDPTGRVVLMDFGIARVLEETQFTRTGVSVGTPEYMSPEQVMGTRIGPPTDVYAVGVLAYQMLAGRVPFEGATPVVMHAQAYEPPPSLAGRRPGLRPEVYTIIDAALAKLPEQRPATVAALVRALQTGLRTGPAQRTQPVTPPESHRVPSPVTPPAARRTPAAERTQPAASPLRPARSPQPVRRATSEPPADRAATPLPAPTTSSRRVQGWPFAVATAMLLVVGGLTVAIVSGRVRPAGSPTPPSARAASVAATAVAAVSVSSAPPAVPTPVKTPSPAPLAANAVPDSALLRPGTTLVQRVVLPAGGGEPEQIAVQSRGSTSGGCQQAYVDLFRLDTNRRWANAWDATQSPTTSPLLPPATGAACAPAATVKLFASRALQAGGQTVLVVSVADVAGAERLALVGRDAAAQRDTVLGTFTTTPGAQTSLAEGAPITIGVASNAYPPPTSGLQPQYSQPTGTWSALLVWVDGAFQPLQPHLQPRCAQGTLSLSVPENDGRALLFSCDDGSASAASVNGDTSLASGLTVADLQQGDDLSLQLDPATLSPADPLAALPAASAVSSASAALRRQRALQPMPTPSPVPAPRAPVQAPVPNPTVLTAQPVAPRAAPAAPVVPVAPAVTVAPVVPAPQPVARPAPVVPAAPAVLVQTQAPPAPAPTRPPAPVAPRPIGTLVPN